MGTVHEGKFSCFGLPSVKPHLNNVYRVSNIKGKGADGWYIVHFLKMQSTGLFLGIDAHQELPNVSSRVSSWPLIHSLEIWQIHYDNILEAGKDWIKLYFKLPCNVFVWLLSCLLGSTHYKASVVKERL